jgi:hypothetical protein
VEPSASIVEDSHYHRRENNKHNNNAMISDKERLGSLILTPLQLAATKV